MIRRICIWLGALLLSVLLCAASYNPETEENEFAEDYIIGIGDITIFLQSKNSIVYFGRPTCIDCVKFEPTLLKYLAQAEKKIHYFNTQYWKDAQEFEDILSRYQVDSVPMLVAIRDGTFVDRFLPDVSLPTGELEAQVEKFFQRNEVEKMSLEMVNDMGHPVQFTNYFETFTFILTTFNCVSMIVAYKKHKIKDSCTLRLFINATIIFALHIVICIFGIQYSMWAEAEPSTHIFAQVGELTWLFVTPFLYIVTVVFFALTLWYRKGQKNNK